MKYRLLTCFILLAALAGCRRSAPPVSAPTGTIVADRLSNQRVNAFAEDADGHIWIATSRGLNRYSIHEYHQYFSADDTLGLPDNQVNDVFRSSNGTIWAATNGGVARLTPEGQFHCVPAPGRPNANHIWETRDGKLLMSNSAILYQYDPDEDRFRPVIRDFNAFAYPYSVQDGNLLWVLSENGRSLNCYNTDDFSLATSYPTSHTVYHLCDAGNAELWMSGMGRMSIFDTRTRAWKELPDAIRNESRLMEGDVDIIYNVDDRSILLNVIGKGMFHYYRTTDRVLFQDDAGFPFELPGTEIRTIFRDSEHNLWFGTSDQGYTVSYLYKNQFNGNKFLTSTFARKTVTSLCLDQEQRLWIATLRDGLWLYDLRKKDLRNVDEDSLVPNNSVGYNRCSKVFCDSGGDLWLFFQGKYWVVRCRYEGGRFQVLDNLFVANANAIAEDGQGRIWLGGMSNSLIRYDKATRESTSVTVWNDSETPFVTDLEMTDQGGLVVAGLNRMLVSVDTFTGEVTELPMTEEEKAVCARHSALRATCLLKDSAGEFWAGTTANGLLRHTGFPAWTSVPSKRTARATSGCPR